MNLFPQPIQNRIPARALFYALVVALLMAMMSGLLISLAAMQRQQQTDQFDKERHIANIKSGVALLRATRENNILKEINLYQEATPTFSIAKRDWGMFSVGTVISITSQQQDTFSRSFYLGDPAPLSMKAALYLVDQKEPLTISGRTQIQGAVYLPKAAVRTAAIEGQDFKGKPLRASQKLHSQSRLPAFNKNKVERLLHYFQQSAFRQTIPKVLNRSFRDSSLLFTANDFNLQGVHLHGNIMIYARDSIIIGADSQLEDVLIFAPRIIIQSGFKGQLQAFASQQLIVEGQVRMEYPSVLGVLKSNSEDMEYRLEVGENTFVSGLLFLHEKQFSRRQGMVAIAEGAIIEGQVFAEGWVELKGEVRGNLSCRKFHLKTPSSVYSNHLLNATINRNRLPNYFASPLVEEGGEEVLVKWVK